MGTPPLVDADIINGRVVVDGIKHAVPIRQAFWAHFSGAEEWRLVIVTLLADSVGPLGAYTAVQRALPENSPVPLRRIAVVGPADPLVSFLAVTPRWEGAVTVTSSARSPAGGMVDSIYLYPKPYPWSG